LARAFFAARSPAPSIRSVLMPSPDERNSYGREGYEHEYERAYDTPARTRSSRVPDNGRLLDPAHSAHESTRRRSLYGTRVAKDSVLVDRTPSADCAPPACARARPRSGTLTALRRPRAPYASRPARRSGMHIAWRCTHPFCRSLSALTRLAHVPSYTDGVTLRT
jgi:hypothetical protein